MIESCPRCIGKQSFTSQSQAAKVARQMSRSRNSSREGGATAYRCDACRQWRIGHAPKRQPDAKRRSLRR